MLGWTGIGRYTLELLQNLEQIDAEGDYQVLLQSADWDKWQPKAANFTRVKANVRPYSLAEQIILPKIVRSLKPDLVHYLSFNSPVISAGKRVTTVHDLTLVDFSTARGGLLKKLRFYFKQAGMRLQIRSVLMQSSAIVTDAKYVLRDLKKRHLVPRKALSKAIHLGPPSLPSGESKPPIEGNYILYVGNYYPNKNIGRLIDSSAKVIQQHPDCKLVLAGKADEFRDQLDQKIEASNLKDHVVFSGFVTDEELRGLYQNAKLYVFPSLSEGFGLPGLEAMQYGLPVVSSDASCLPEIYGDAAVYFDPLDTKDMAEKISVLLSNEKMRQDLIKAGHERVKQFSWRRMAEETLEVYNQVLNKD
jgi:glycosyltransferase involved in cell wall biosynthesis